MAELYSFNRSTRQSRPTFFDRSELNQLLSLYSRHVASGDWRDYAIDQRGGVARFCVFQHSMGRPLYTITKRPGGPEYHVYSGPERLKCAASLGEALAIFERHLQVVS